MSKKKKNRITIFDATAENDIRYLGPLNYRHFQIFGWLCIVCGQANMIIGLGGRLDPSVLEQFAGVKTILEGLSEMSLPFLLIANFAQILDDRDGYKKQFLKNAGASVGIFLLYQLMMNRYIIGSLAGLFVDPNDSKVIVDTLLQTIAPTGFLCFNLFIDLLLCTLVMFFLNYVPKRCFRGKWLHVFRLFAILPVAYEVFCMYLKIQSANRVIALPYWSFPLLTVKPPMTFVLFLILAVFIKVRELRFRRHGKTRDEYQAFLATRRNSRNFSIFLAIMIVVVSLIDLAVVTGYSAVSIVNELMERQAIRQQLSEQEAATLGTDPVISTPTPEAPQQTGESPAAETPKASVETLSAGDTIIEVDPENEEDRALIEEKVRVSTALGFGGSIPLITLAPLVLLFSYTRIPRTSARAGILIPLISIVLILFLYLEALRMLMWNLPIQKLDLQQLREEIIPMLLSMQSMQ